MSPWSKIAKVYQRNAASLVFKRPFVIRSTRSVISFTFDDFPRSALLIGGAILNRYGLVGTYYVSLGLAGKQEASGEMFVESDLSTLLERGHELGCHTFSHLDSWQTDWRTFELSILENRAALKKLLPEAEFKSFSYPISPPRPLTKANAAKHFTCCRGNIGQTLYWGTTDLNQLASYFLEKSRDNLPAIKLLIDRSRQVCGWLIFATHDISDTPSPFGCTPRLFEDVVQQAVQSGALILPVSRALEVLSNQGKLACGA